MHGIQRRAPAQTEFDPALLAFVKCHITSFVKWDVLHALSERVGCWTGPEELAQARHRPADEIGTAMLELSREGVLEVSGSADQRTYRLPEGEPTTRVVSRLIKTATSNQRLRRIIVARVLGAAIARPNRRARQTRRFPSVTLSPAAWRESPV